MKDVAFFVDSKVGYSDTEMGIKWRLTRGSML